MTLVVRDFERLTFGMQLDGDDFLTEIISLILDHIEDYMDAQFNIGEFVSSMVTLYENIISKADHDNFELAIRNMAYAIFNNLAGMGAYDEDQVLRFRFGSYVGKDMLFRRMTQDEIENGPV